MSKILITGGAGLIGAQVIRRFVTHYPDSQIFNTDQFDVAPDLLNAKVSGTSSNYKFIKGDIADADFVNDLFEAYQFDSVIHLASESPFDPLVNNSTQSGMTNIVGTLNLLNASKRCWKQNYDLHRFYHVSTDELCDAVTDDLCLRSKASSDHFVRAYHQAYGMNTVISNCSNNYGANNFAEELIAINKIKNNTPVPVYGKGQDVLNWLWVEDQACAIDVIFHQSEAGGTYNIGGHKEWYNVKVNKKQKLAS